MTFNAPGEWWPFNSNSMTTSMDVTTFGGWWRRRGSGVADVVDVDDEHGAKVSFFKQVVFPETFTCCKCEKPFKIEEHNILLGPTGYLHLDCASEWIKRKILALALLDEKS